MLQATQALELRPQTQEALVRLNRLSAQQILGLGSLEVEPPLQRLLVAALVALAARTTTIMQAVGSLVPLPPSLLLVPQILRGAYSGTLLGQLLDQTTIKPLAALGKQPPR